MEKGVSFFSAEQARAAGGGHCGPVCGKGGKAGRSGRSAAERIRLAWASRSRSGPRGRRVAMGCRRTAWAQVTFNADYNLLQGLQELSRKRNFPAGESTLGESTRPRPGRPGRRRTTARSLRLSSRREVAVCDIM